MIATSFVNGLKGDHPKYYRANAICKHFDAYGGPEDLPQSRLSFNAQVPICISAIALDNVVFFPSKNSLLPWGIFLLFLSSLIPFYDNRLYMSKS